jgi:hypothetical protein
MSRPDQTSGSAKWKSNSPGKAHFLSQEMITRFLFLKDDPSPVDLCFVLGSPTPSSMQPATQLYLNGLTPKISISGFGPLPLQEGV